MTDSGLSGIIEKLREENAFLNDMLENAHNRSRLLEQQLAQAHREGWEQAKREADSLLLDLIDVVLESKPVVQSARRAIANMPYKEPRDD